MAETIRQAIQTARLATQTTLDSAQTKYGETHESIRDDLDTVISESAATTLYRDIFSHITADSAEVNASTTVVASGLAVTLPIGTYEIDAVVSVTTAAAADIKFQWVTAGTVTGTVGVSDIFLINGPGGTDGSVAYIPARLGTSWTTAITYATTGALTDAPFHFKGIITCTVAGALSLKFAQGTSDASNTHIDSGSYLIARKVA